MIKTLTFQNFRVLRNAKLPLGPFTLLVGANGAGKSTALQAFKFLLGNGAHGFDEFISADLREAKKANVSVAIKWKAGKYEFTTERQITKSGNQFDSTSINGDETYVGPLRKALQGFRVFAFQADAVSAAVETSPHPELGANGSNLAGVLDALRDSHPEKFEALNKELNQWLPEFDRILFQTPAAGKKTFRLRASRGGYSFSPTELSQGVLFALAFLAIAYLPNPPALISFEEPDRGIHPRLLRDIQDAMYRLAFPDIYGEQRAPVQVIATTHSPYLVDLYKDRPDQIVITHKDENGGHFERLSDKPHIAEILEGAPLGEVWFSGVLGGVPIPS